MQNNQQRLDSISRRFDAKRNSQMSKVSQPSHSQNKVETSEDQNSNTPLYPTGILDIPQSPDSQKSKGNFMLASKDPRQNQRTETENDEDYNLNNMTVVLSEDKSNKKQ